MLVVVVYEAGAPLYDETKQAAIMLMTGHAAKSKLVTSKPKTPSYVVKKPSPAQRAEACRSTPRGRSSYTRPSQKRSTTSLQTSKTDTPNVSVRNVSRRSRRESHKKSPLLSNPKKSALKDPKKLTRKTESIKFDLSNLENDPQESSAVVAAADSDCGTSEELTLRYSESPSPRLPIHSRTSRILENSIGVPMTLSPRQIIQLDTSNTRKSSRSSLIVQKALENSTSDKTRNSIGTTQSPSVASAFKTRTLSPRSNPNMESYSIVDLVSIDSNESRSASLYNSATTDNNTTFGTPQNSIGRRTRSTLDPTLLGSSTPYVGKTTLSNYPQNTTRSSRSRSNMELSQRSDHTPTDLTSARRSNSLSTPVNARSHVSVNSTRVPRPSRSRSRLNDSDLVLIDGNESDASPKSSKRINRTTKSVRGGNTTQREPFNHTNPADDSSKNRENTTPENGHSPQEFGTPVLRIQSLLDSSQNSTASRNSSTRSGRVSRRKTTSVLTVPKKRSPTLRPKSLNMTTRRSKLNLTRSSENSDDGAAKSGNEVVTPKSAVKLVPEAVKNKHSTAKKPQSKRSIIDDLDQSDIVKHLFNSPVKRKLSQSMTEFSRKRLFEDDEDVTIAKTIARISGTPENSPLDRTQAITPEVFVSPITTPRHSPNMAGIKRLFAKTSPENSLTDLRGVKLLLRSPRPRRSPRNDLTNVSGVKLLFAKSPQSRLSDVNVKNAFANSPNNDLRRVSGVKTLFRRQKEYQEPENNLSDVRGVKELFRGSPSNDLRNVSCVKRMVRRRSPRNELTDVSGVEELLEESQGNTERLFDRLLGKPEIKSVYSKTFSSRSAERRKPRAPKTLHFSIDEITNNVEQWLEGELQRRVSKHAGNDSLRRELKRLATDTVEGGRRRLPIKKRSVGARPELVLPIKKRKVVHSTPVKNNLSMNPSDLSRVSPIQAVAAATPPRLDTDHRSPVKSKDISTRLSKSKSTKEKTVTPKSGIKASPRKTRAKTKVTKKSPAAGRTRARANNKPSLLVNKKAPNLTPQLSEKRKTAARKSDININQNKNETTSNKVQTKKQVQFNVVETTPKRTARAKKQKAAITVTKPSPVLKPRASKKTNIKQPCTPSSPPTTQQNNVKAKRTRNTAPSSLSPPKPPEGRRKTRAVTDTQTDTKTNSTKVQKRDTKIIEQKAATKKSRKTLSKSASLEDDTKPVKVKPVNGKKDKSAKTVSIKAPVETKPRNTRRRAQTDGANDTKATASKRGETRTLYLESSSSTTTATSNRTTQTRSKKQVTIIEDTKPEETGRGRRKTAKVTDSVPAEGQQKQSAGKKGKGGMSTTKQVEEAAGKSTRATRAGKVVEQVASARNTEKKLAGGKRSAVVTESEPAAKRKRGNNVKTSTVKEPAKKPVAGRKGGAPRSPAPPPPPTVTRRAASGNEHTEVATQRRNRTRKR